MDAVTLRELTESNRAAVVGLSVAPAQRRFVGSVAGARQGDGEPWPFYRSLGFRPTGEHDEAGEIILSLDLSE